VATTAPNFARGGLVPVTFMFTELTPAYLSAPNTAFILGILCIGLSFISVYTIEETYGKELDYLEMKTTEEP
jgi:MFS transporter, putative metabolite:H+ symporter